MLHKNYKSASTYIFALIFSVALFLGVNITGCGTSGHFNVPVINPTVEPTVEPTDDPTVAPDYEEIEVDICFDFDDEQGNYFNENCTLAKMGYTGKAIQTDIDVEYHLYKDGAEVTELVIPETFESGGKKYRIIGIGDFAFDYCQSLTSVTVPDSVAYIGVCAFRGNALTSFDIPDGVTVIKKEAFNGCGAMTSVTLPKSLTSIEERAFEDCNSLTSVVIPEGIASIEEDTFTGCSKLASVTIPESVASIGVNAFSYCSALESVVIPDAVASIGEYAFYESGLTSVTIPDGVGSIGDYAFRNCDNLTEITWKGTVYTDKTEFNNDVKAAGIADDDIWG